MPLIILKTCIKPARLRLYSSVGKFNSCSLSLYDKCLRVESFLVALLFNGACVFLKHRKPNQITIVQV